MDSNSLALRADILSKINFYSSDKSSLTQSGINKVLIFFISIIISASLVWNKAYAEEFYLKNGDRISGQIISENDNVLLIETQAMGQVSVSKSFLAVKTPKKVVSVVKEKLWSGELSLGYNKSGGNTINSQMVNSLYLNRKTDHNEFTIKGDSYYSSTNKKMDSQNWRGMGRYAFSFGEKNWYNFYKLEGDHDRFAGVDYRLIPSVGIGYWFSDSQDWKAMVETGLGFEHTSYNDGATDKNELVLIPRAFFEKKIFKAATISQDLTLYPSLKDVGEFRLRLEIALTSPINEKMSLRFSFIDDYDSFPARNAKKNDTKIISSLVYSF